MSLHTVAVGDLVVDHLFVARRDGTHAYIGSTGGGSASNAAATIAAFSGEAGFLCATGANPLSDFAIASLGASGVTLIESEQSLRLMPRVVSGVESGYRKGEFRFSARCAVCSRVQSPSRLLKLGAPGDSIVSRLRESQVVLFDRIGGSRMRLVQGLRDGPLLALDLGHTAFFRFQPIGYVLQALSEFHVVQMSRRVLDSLLKRSGVAGVEALGAWAPQVGIVVTDGRRGVNVYANDGVRLRLARSFDAPEVAGGVVDSSGAGDTLFGLTLLGVGGAAMAQRRRAAETLVGAVGRALEFVPGKLSTYGARGHLGQRPRPPRRVPAAWLGANIDEFREEALRAPFCPFCESEQGKGGVSRSRRKVGSRSVSAHLAKRVLASVGRRELIAELSSVLAESDDIACIGTGGSFAAASFVASLLTMRTGRFVPALRPLDFVRSGIVPRVSILFSYSGRTADIVESMRHARERSKVVLVTGARSVSAASEVMSDGDIVISYAPDPKRYESAPERGFLSFAGVVAPAAVFAAVEFGVDEVTRTVLAAERAAHSERWRHAIAKLARGVERSGRLHVVGGGNSWASMIDIESKCVESGLALPLLHESKDLSHGRFVSLLRNSSQSEQTEVLGDEELSAPVLFLSAGRPTRYEQFLLRSLGSAGDVFHLASRRGGVRGGLELLVRCQYTLAGLGRELGVDISRPRFVSPRGLALYHWSNGLVE